MGKKGAKNEARSAKLSEAAERWQHTLKRCLGETFDDFHDELLTILYLNFRLSPRLLIFFFVFIG